MLFLCGCGCLFEGMFVQMFVLFDVFVVLLDDICVYCVYEYMLLNICFVFVCELGNVVFVVWCDDVQVLCVCGVLMLFIMIVYECVVNLFMWVDSVVIYVMFEVELYEMVMDCLVVFMLMCEWKNWF